MNATDFLQKYFEYHCYWEPSYGSENQPAQIRKKQLLALMHAFSLNHTKNNDFDAAINHFKSASFINDVKQEVLLKCESLINEVNAFITESPHSKRLQLLREDLDYKSIFRSLLAFRMKLEPLYIADGVQLEGFGSFNRHFYNYRKGRLLKILRKSTQEIDDLLALIIDPKQQRFNKDQLIESFHYPVESVDSAEIDYFSW